MEWTMIETAKEKSQYENFWNGNFIDFFYFILIFKFKFKTGRERKTAPFRAGESKGGECCEYINYVRWQVTVRQAAQLAVADRRSIYI